ncbi:MAG TPA: Abi-alpha family protein [Acidimicrobiales bacterium]|nr:Abi-alpha family protein [Acidimicrobiales bacterium]
MSDATPPEKTTAEQIAEMLPGLARIARTAAESTVRWALDTNREALRRFVEDPRPVKPPAPTASSRLRELQDMGAKLLRDSADVSYKDGVHPAFTHVLQELVPDEARILRFLYKNGPQPSVDVRTNRPMGRGSEKVASGLSMIGLYAGVRNQDDTAVELANLERLRLIWFSKEQVADPSVYQLLEAQPDVIDAMKRAGRSPRTEHRSIELTPFGQRFCETCLPLD